MDVGVMLAKIILGRWGPSYETLVKMRRSVQKDEMKCITRTLRDKIFITPSPEVSKQVRS
jgi:hypothetical protein